MNTSLKKIEQLTPEQIARFPEYVRKWVNMGLHPGPTDDTKAIEAVKALYTNVGKKAPRVALCTSPLVACLTIAILRTVKFDLSKIKIEGQSAEMQSSLARTTTKDLSDQVSDQVLDQVLDQVRAQVSDQVRDLSRNFRWWWLPGGYGTAHWSECRKKLGKQQRPRLGSVVSMRLPFRSWLNHRNLGEGATC